MRAALGSTPQVPPRFVGLLELPQHVEVVDVDVDAVKRYIATHSNDPAHS